MSNSEENPCFRLAHVGETVFNSAIVAPVVNKKQIIDLTVGEALSEYWSGHIVSLTCQHVTMLEKIMSIYMDRNLISQISDMDLFKFLNGKTQVTEKLKDKIYVNNDYNKVINTVDLIYSSRTIGFILKDTVGTPEIVAYQRLVKEIHALAMGEQRIMISVIERVKGKIELLASNVTTKNLSYVMKKLKITSTLKLIHEIFRNPSVLGKFGAIWQLLEVHEIIWLDIDWVLVQDLIKYIYDILIWLFEKVKAFGGKISDGLHWVKAKCTRSGNEELPEEFVDAMQELPDPNLPEDPAKQSTDEPPPVEVTKQKCFKCESVIATFCCATCSKKFCSCIGEEKCCLKQLKHIYQIGCCDPDSNNDCFWRAVAKSEMCDVDTLKFSVSEHMKDPDNLARVVAEYTKDTGIDLDGETFLKSLSEQMKKNIMCESESVYATQDYVKTPLLINHGGRLLHRQYKLSQWKDDPIILDLSSNHYTNVGEIKNFNNCGNFCGVTISCEEHVKVAEPEPTPPEEEKKETENKSALTPEEEERLREISLAAGIEITKHKMPEKETKEFVSNLEKTKVGSEVKGWFSRCFTNLTEFFQNNPIVGALFSMAAGLCTFLGITIPFLNGNVEKDGLIRRFTEATRSVYYAQKGTEGIFTAFKGTINAMKDVMGISTNKRVSDFKDAIGEMLEVSVKMIEIASTRPAEIVNNGSAFLDFQAKYKLMLSKYVELTKMSTKDDLRSIQPIWYMLTRNFERIQDNYNKLLTQMGDRQVPVGIWLWGPSDIGKSHLCSYLIEEVNNKLGEKLNKTTLSKGNEFWNNYCQQSHIVIDDFNSIRDETGDKDAMNFFNLITPAAFNPNQASLGDKMIMANPRFVWVNSNYPSVGVQTAISNIEAFERRRHVFAYVSWPEHTKDCKPGNYTCEHWKKVGKDMSDFSHLTIHIQDPLVSNVNTKGKSAGHKQDILDGKGVKVTIDELVDVVLSYEKKFKDEYEAVINRKKKNGEFSFLDIVNKQAVEDWDNMPTILVSGPPGTGKTHILEAMIKKKGALKPFRVTKKTDFTELAKAKFCKPGYDYVIIDDFSSHITQKEAKDFIEFIKNRYDDKDPTVQQFYVGINRFIFEQFIFNTFKTEEYVDMIMRRSHVVDCSYRKKPLNPLEKIKFALKNDNKSTFYSADDTKNLQGLKIDDVVKYEFDGTERTQATIIKILSEIQAQIKEDKLQYALGSRVTVDPSIVCTTPVSSDDFCEILNEKSSMKVLSFLKGNNCKILTKKRTISQILVDLMNTIRNCKATAGCAYLDMDDFVLQCVSGGFLDEFAGEMIVFQFGDKSYYLDVVNLKRAEVGFVQDIKKLNSESLMLLKETVSALKATDFISAFSSNLPPWFTLSGDIVSKVISTCMSGIFAATGIMQQEQMYTDSKRASTIRETVITATNEAIDTSLQKMIHKIHPAPHVKNTSRVIDMDEHDVLKEESPGDKSDSKRQNPREKSRGEKNANWRYPAKEHNPDKQYLERPFEKKINRTGAMKETYELCLDRSWDSDKQEEVAKEVMVDPSLPNIISTVANNMCAIEDLTGSHLCHGVFVKNKILTTVAHVLDNKKIENLRVRDNDDKVWRVKFSYKNETVDRLDLEVDDKSFQNKRDISNHFSSRDALIPYNTPAVMVCVSRRVLPGKLVTYLRSYIVKNEKIVTYIGETKKRTLLEYSGHRIGCSLTGVQTSGGDCGSLLVISDPSWTLGKVVAMHTSATRYEAFGRMMFEDNYKEKEIVKESVNVGKLENNSFVDPEWYIKSTDEENPALIGRLRTVRNHIPEKTTLYRNKYPIGDRIYEPAILSNKDPRNPDQSPLKTQCMKWCYPSEDKSTNKYKKMFAKCAKQMGIWYGETLKNAGVVCRKMTKTEALNKLSGCPTSEPLNMKSSAGVPWKWMGATPSKREYIDVDENGILHFKKGPLTQKLHNKIDELMNDHKNGHKADVVFLACNKDETVKISKIKEARTRTIAAAPLCHSIFGRMILHPLFANMAAHWDIIPPKSGINALGYGWDLLFRRLAKVSLVGTDLDFKGWDFNVRVWCRTYLAEMIIEMCKILYVDWTEDDSERVRTYYRTTNNFKLLIGNELYRTALGEPSGAISTTPDNSLLNDLFSFTNYCMQMEQINPKLCNIASYREDVGIATTGDDILMTFSEFIKDHFNALTVKPYYEAMGFEVTTGEKNAVVIPYKPLMDCTFLSRKFVRKGSFIIGPLLYERLCRPTWWIHGKPARLYWENPDALCPSVSTMIEAMDSACNEASLHSDEVFNEFREAYAKIAAEYGFSPPMQKEDYLIRMFGLPEENDLSEFGFNVYDERELLKMDMNYPRDNIVHFKNRSVLCFGPQYDYGGAKHVETKVPKNLKKLLDTLNAKYQREWNSILVNEYPEGGFIPWHKDNEPMLQQNEGVGCLTIKGSGSVRIKSDYLNFKIDIIEGDFYMMDSYCLREFQHMRDNHKEKTISLTFRKIK